MYGCDPWKDKEEAIERRLDVVESKTLDHDRDLIDLNGTVDANRVFAETLISTRASRGAFSDIEVAANTSTVIIAMEREDGGIVLRSMPVVTSDNAGVAPPSLFSEVAVLRSEVDGMKGTVVWYPNAQNTLTNDMTSTQVATSFAVAYPGVAPGDGTIYQNTDGTAGYRYSRLLESWVEISAGVSIDQFTNVTLGMIKGSTTEGQVFAETDGTGSVVGWDDLIADVGEMMTNKEDVSNKRQSFHPVPSPTAYPSEALVKSELDKKVDSNPAITAGTGTKVTYDSKGLVTAGENLEKTDIPSLSADKITSGIFSTARIPTLPISKTSGLQTALDGKQGNLTFDDVPVSGSNNPVKSGGIYTALAELGAPPTFDDVPVSGSNNPVKSGGIYDALAAIIEDMFTHGITPDRLVTLIVPPIDCATLATMYKDDTTLTKTPVINAQGCTSMYEVFRGCTNLETVGYILTPNVTTMWYMFYECSSLTSVPAMDTSSVSNMNSMFRYCTSLTSVPAMDTSSVTNMGSMFRDCTSLTSVPPMDTSSVSNMGYTFRNCSSLTSVPAMDTSSVTAMEYMFHNCPSLTSVPAMDTSRVTHMENMFYNCPSLTSVPAMDTSSVIYMAYMFRGCPSLTTVPPMDTSSVSNMDGMFRGCSSLTSVTFTGTVVPPYGTDMFYGTPIASGGGSIWVPDDLVDAYKTAEGWSNHASVIKGISQV